MPPPAVTSTTTVVPAPPRYPPLPSVPQVPTRGIPAPGPDVKIMVPDAAPRVDAINKLTASNAPGTTPFEPDPTVAQEHAWNLQDLFTSLPTSGTPRRNWPPSDAFTLYLMATLSRFSYTQTGGTDPDLRLARDAIKSALDPDTVYSRTDDESANAARFDRWATPAGYLFAFPGTTQLSQWFTYAPPLVAPVSGIGTTAGVWGGISLQLPKYTDKFADPNTGLSGADLPAILTGHSLGGALAQLLCAQRNVASQNLVDAQRNPVRGVWTFGAPAFLADPTGARTYGTFDVGCRVYLEGDPIPYATQFVISRAAGVTERLAVLAPGFYQQPSSTAHAANKEVSLIPMNASDRTRFRDAALRSLIPGNGDALLKQIIAQHAVQSYTAAAYENVRDSSYAPKDRLAWLYEANQRMDRLSYTNPNVIGVGS